MRKAPLVTACTETGLGAEDRDYRPVTGKKGAGGITSGAAWRWWEVVEPGTWASGCGVAAQSPDGSQLGARPPGTEVSEAGKVASRQVFSEG